MFNAKSGRAESQTLVGESWAKFVELWKGGSSASFYVECWNGEARLYFSTLLGNPEEFNHKMAEPVKPEHSSSSGRKYSPSKLKRNQLRLQAFLEKKRRESCKDPAVKEEETLMRQEPCLDTNATNPQSTETENGSGLTYSEPIDMAPYLAKPLESQLETSYDHDAEEENKDTFLNDSEIGDKEGDMLPFSDVKTLLQRIKDDGWIEEYSSVMTSEEEDYFWKKDTREGRIKPMKDDPKGTDIFSGVFGSRDVIGYFVEKEIFEGLDHDLFVYEIYLEVLTAQAQFECIFQRQWESEYLFVPWYIVEKVEDYLQWKGANTLVPGQENKSSFNNEGPCVTSGRNPGTGGEKASKHFT